MFFYYTKTIIYFLCIIIIIIIIIYTLPETIRKAEEYITVAESKISG